MIEQTITQLRELKLSGMANALIAQREQPGTYEGLAFEQRLQLLTDSEQLERSQRKQQRLVKAAQLKIGVFQESCRLKFKVMPPCLPRSQMASFPG